MELISIENVFSTEFQLDVYKFPQRKIQVQTSEVQESGRLRLYTQSSIYRSWHLGKLFNSLCLFSYIIKPAARYTEFQDGFQDFWSFLSTPYLIFF